MSLDLTEDKSTLVQVMAWCRQARDHYLSQCWPRSLPPFGVTRPQWVKLIRTDNRLYKAKQSKPCTFFTMNAERCDIAKFRTEQYVGQCVNKENTMHEHTNLHTHIKQPGCFGKVAMPITPHTLPDPKLSLNLNLKIVYLTSTYYYSDFDRSASCVFYAKKITKDASLLKCWGPRDALYSCKWNTFIIISLYPFAYILPQVIFLKCIQYLQRCIQLNISEKHMQDSSSLWNQKIEQPVILLNMSPTAISTGDRHGAIHMWNCMRSQGHPVN